MLQHKLPSPEFIDFCIKVRDGKSLESYEVEIKVTQNGTDITDKLHDLVAEHTQAIVRKCESLHRDDSNDTIFDGDESEVDICENFQNI